MHTYIHTHTHTYIHTYIELSHTLHTFRYTQEATTPLIGTCCELWRRRHTGCPYTMLMPLQRGPWETNCSSLVSALSGTVEKDTVCSVCVCVCVLCLCVITLHVCMHDPWEKQFVFFGFVQENWSFLGGRLVTRQTVFVCTVCWGNKSRVWFTACIKKFFYFCNGNTWCVCQLMQQVIADRNESLNYIMEPS